MDDRRKFERMPLPESANVHVLDSAGKRLGRVRKLGARGLVIETAPDFSEGSPHHVTLVDESSHIRLDLIVVARCATPEGYAFDFRALDADVAVEIGVILGRHAMIAQAVHA